MKPGFDWPEQRISTGRTGRIFLLRPAKRCAGSWSKNARRKKRLKRGGQLHRVEFDEANAFGPMPDDDLLALDEALERLALIDARAAQVVNLCYFGGLTQPQAAKELAVSLSTIERSWSFARAWLFREIQKSKNAGT